jgi:pimeloyl-ACP methyl ester carboxylesterase
LSASDRTGTGAAPVVSIDGVRLEYEWYGPAPSEAPTIVFLHEGLGSISRWRDFPAALCRRLGWGGLVYNRQGYGGSDAMSSPLTPQFLHREAIDVLPPILDAFAVTRPVIFGHSDGGSIALIYAASGVAPPRALVLEAPHVFVEDVTVASIAALRRAYRSSGTLSARLERHHGVNAGRLFSSWTDVWLSGAFRDWSIKEALSRITCAALVIQGRDDEYGTAEQVDAIAAGVSGPIETLLLDGCGHSPHLDRGDAVEAAAVRFLRSTSRVDAPC